MAPDALRGGKRSESRLRTRLPARLITLDGEFRVVLSDLSCGGARFSRHALPTRTGDAVLQWDRFEAFGEIRWNDGSACGLRFCKPIPAAWVIATRDMNDAQALPSDKELTRRRAGDWITGKTRC